MSKSNVQHPYRIEERGWPSGRVPALEFGDRDEAIEVFDAIARTSAEVRRHNPHIRLVLLGPTRRTLPQWPSWARAGSAQRAALRILRRLRAEDGAR